VQRLPQADICPVAKLDLRCLVSIWQVRYPRLARLMLVAVARLVLPTPRLPLNRLLVHSLKSDVNIRTAGPGFYRCSLSASFHIGRLPPQRNEAPITRRSENPKAQQVGTDWHLWVGSDRFLVFGLHVYLEGLLEPRGGHADRGYRPSSEPISRGSFRCFGYRFKRFCRCSSTCGINAVIFSGIPTCKFGD
jgi:hypothetical protein